MPDKMATGSRCTTACPSVENKTEINTLDLAILEDDDWAGSSLTPIVDYISDDQLSEIAFSLYLRRLTKSTALSSYSQVQPVERVTQVLWNLLRKSSYSMRQKFALYVADNLQLIASTFEGLCTHLESCDYLASGLHLCVYTKMIYLICNSIKFEPNLVATFQETIQTRKLLLVLKHITDNTRLDAIDREGIAATLLLLYVCADRPHVSQVLKHSNCLQTVYSLVQSSSVKIKIFSKALIARLIPVDTIKDDVAVLLLIDDEELDYLIKILTLSQSKYAAVPIVPVMVDLSRSPHNLYAFVAKGIASLLSDIMDSISEHDQIMAAQLIWRIMTFNYKENESTSAIIYDGTLQKSLDDEEVDKIEGGNRDQKAIEISQKSHQVPLDKCFLSYVLSGTKLLEAGSVLESTSALVHNICVAILLHYQLIQQLDDKLVEETKLVLRHSPEGYQTICSLVSLMCNIHYKDVESMEKRTAYDLHAVLLQSLVWWTCDSETADALSKTGLITVLTSLLHDYVQFNSVGKIQLCIEVLINCASNSSNLPAFNSNYSHSYIVLLALPLTHGKYPDIALKTKMLLTLLEPLLDCDQLRALKLARNEANVCVSLLSEAVKAHTLEVKEATLLTHVRVVVGFSQEYHRQDQKLLHESSEYEKKLVLVSNELKANVQLLVESGLLSILKDLLEVIVQDEVRITVVRLLWCLCHDPAIKAQVLGDSDIVGALQKTYVNLSTDMTVVSHDLLSLVDHKTEDSQSLLLYAKCCYEFKNFFECVETCDAILRRKEAETMMQTKVIKGKAKFHAYKRKLMEYVVNKNIRVTKEGSNILKECFNYMKEAISLLGNALDQNMLDTEGSTLLDWAMIDCVSTTNQLNLVKRCLLCRLKKPLRKSHIWPLSIIKSLTESTRDNSCIFGLNKHQLKTVGVCIYHMLCSECEERLSQNGENDYHKIFQPACEEISYSSLLFSLCAGIVFRCLSTVALFPKHFNDSKVYEVLLECRKHILPLKAKIKGKDLTLSDSENRQLQELSHHLNGTLDIFLFFSPLKTQKDYGVCQMPYPQACVAVSDSVKLHTTQPSFNGYAHFVLLCCGPVSLIINFDQSMQSTKSKGFHITSNPMNSDQRYTVQPEKELVALLPVGVWSVIEQTDEQTISNFSNVLRFTSPSAPNPIIQPSPATDLSIPVQNSSIMLPFNYLPEGYEIKPYAELPHGRCVVLPEAHQIIVHSTLSVPSQNTDLTFLLCIDEHKSTPVHEYLYVIFVSRNSRAHFLYLDSATVEVQDDKLVLAEFMQQSKIADQMRQGLNGLQLLLNRVLPTKHFDNINLLLQLIKCRRCIRGPLAHIQPSLDQKCSPNGCWYCSDICHNCMQPSLTMYSGALEDRTLLKFCSEQCKGLWFHSEDQKPFYAVSYLDEGTISKQPMAPLMTIIVAQDKCVEQFFLSLKKVSKVQSSETPFIMWQIKRLQTQYFPHFYISKECMPLGDVWVKHFCTADSEIATNVITSGRVQFQLVIQKHFDQVVKKYKFDDFESFIKQALQWRNPDAIPFFYDSSTDALNQMAKPALQNYLPPGFTLCHPQIGFDHGSLKVPSDHLILLHYTEQNDSFQNTYFLARSNGERPQLLLITVKHNLAERRYLADGVLLSSSDAHVTQFLHNTAYTKRGQSIEEMNSLVKGIISKMLKANGISSISLLMKYGRVDSLAFKLDLKCPPFNNCWYCKQVCVCCSNFGADHEDKSLVGFCCTECHAMLTLDPSVITPIFQNTVQLAMILNTNDPTFIAIMTRVLPTSLGRNTVLKILLSRCNGAGDCETGTLFAICQIKTTSTQVVIDCVLSKDCTPLRPVWYTEQCEQMIEKYRILLQSEISLLVNQTLQKQT